MKNADSGLFARMAKTRRTLASGLAGLLADGGMDDALLDDLHDQLLLADVGVAASARIINRLRRHANAAASAELSQLVREVVTEIVAPCEQPLTVTAGDRPPFVILMVGVNGTGKTTTLAKIAGQLKSAGKQPMLAACDTFRAAAIEQLQDWGGQLGVPVIAQSQSGRGAQGADPAAVAFDALTAARARGVDVLLIDTAGRQHIHADLMAQLQKIKRVVAKADPAAPHEVLLCVDAGTGHNALSQAEHFHRAVGVTGLCVTKLDGTAKGGVVVALAERFGLPFRYLGVGQAADDLREFHAAEFVRALLPPAINAREK